MKPTLWATDNKYVQHVVSLDLSDSEQPKAQNE